MIALGGPTLCPGNLPQTAESGMLCKAVRAISGRVGRLWPPPIPAKAAGFGACLARFNR